MDFNEEDYEGVDENEDKVGDEDEVKDEDEVEDEYKLSAAQNLTSNSWNIIHTDLGMMIKDMKDLNLMKIIDSQIDA